MLGMGWLVVPLAGAAGPLGSFIGEFDAQN
jgi:hypothetical protein